MATTGTQTSYGGPSGKYYLQTKWTLLSQSVTGNSSRINIKMYIGAVSGWSASIGTNSFSVSVTGGGSWSGSNRSISINGSKQLLIDEDYTVDHNSDGAKSISINPYFTGSYIGTINPGSFSDSLPSIARTSSISSTASLTAGFDKTITIDSNSSSFTHELSIYITKGTSTDFIKSITYGKGDYSQSTNFSNTEIEDFFNNGYEAWDGVKMVLETFSGSTSIGTVTKTGTLSWSSDNSSASTSSFTVGNAVTVNVSKASVLYSHAVELRVGSVVVGSAGISSGTSFEITPNSSLLYSNITDSARGTVDVYIKTVLTASTSTVVKDWSKEDSVNAYITNSNPVAGSLSYLDSNTTTSNLTTNNQLIIPGYSTPQFTFGVGTPKNGATITRYTITIDGKSASRTTAGSLVLPPITAQADTTALLTVVDSRGFTGSRTINVSVLPYEKPSVNISLKRDNGFEDTGKIIVKGTFSTLNGKNNLNGTTDIKYQHKELPSGTLNSFINMTKTITNGNEYTSNTAGFNLSYITSHEFTFVITDRLGSQTIKKILAPGRPLFFIDSVKNSLGFLQFPTKSDTFEMFGKMLFDKNKYATGNSSLPLAERKNDAPIDFANSDAVGINGLYFNDVADNNGEGLMFPKTGTVVNDVNNPNKSYSTAEWNNFRIMDDIGMIDGTPVVRKDTLVLWSGSVSLGSTSIVNFTTGKSVTGDCPNGIVLIFGDDGGDTNLIPFFVPKWCIENYSGKDWYFNIANGGNIAAASPNFAVKITYLYNTGFKGHANNATSTSGVQEDVHLKCIIGI